MGNCLKSTEKEKLNEKSNVQRRIRIGIGLKKGEDGDYHFGLEGGYEKRKNRDLSQIAATEPSKEIAITESSKEIAATEPSKE